MDHGWLIAIEFGLIVGQNYHCAADARPARPPHVGGRVQQRARDIGAAVEVFLIEVFI